MFHSNSSCSSCSSFNKITLGIKHFVYFQVNIFSSFNCLKNLFQTILTTFSTSPARKKNVSIRHFFTIYEFIFMKIINTVSRKALQSTCTVFKFKCIFASSFIRNFDLLQINSHDFKMGFSNTTPWFYDFFSPVGIFALN